MSIPTKFNPLGTLGRLTLLESVFVPKLTAKDTYNVVFKSIPTPSAGKYRCGIKFGDFTASSYDIGVLGTASYGTDQKAGAFFHYSNNGMVFVQEGASWEGFDSSGKTVECTQVGQEIRVYANGSQVSFKNVAAWQEGYKSNVSVRQNKNCSYTFMRVYVADGENMLIDLVPARRADGRLGIYDKVGEKFYEFAS